MADTIAVRFRLNGDPATGLTLASIDIYLTAIAKSNGAATAIWNPENPTAEVSGLGVYIRQATLDFEVNDYLVEYAYTDLSTDVDDVRGWGALGGDPLAEAAIADIAAGVTVTTVNDKTGYSLANGAITAAVIATDAIDADALAADAVSEIQSGLATSASITALNNLSAAQVNAEVVDALTTDTYAEPAAVPAATSSLKDKINWIFALARNKLTQTATTQTLRNDADSADIATATVADDATTATRAEWQ